MLTNAFSLRLLLEKYLPNAEWQLDGIPAKRHEVKYKCCVELYPDVTYTVIVKRRSLFYLSNLIFPMTMIGMLTMLSFLLPAESGEDHFQLSIFVFYLWHSEGLLTGGHSKYLLKSYQFSYKCQQAIFYSTLLV